ncbi:MULTISPECIES: GNAT family N-acetyltransferase [Pseudomonas]|uniref:GCN5-related N-acetyltransferase n=1 Tax=Pseudomonas fulva (strain 12-X) TaxID=743720 RepID=F6AAS8_PSEF1|nr:MULTISPECIES: GNAT family N-acetyltransferase [Pseudomonas]AEF22131.1 GCN5-related N-acetyltransferase [Pseudomonas fulva 12-X]
MELSSKRLHLRQVTTSEWPLFLALHVTPELIRYICSTPTESEIREKFESRLPQWSPDSKHWLCLAIFEAHSNNPVGVTGLKLESENSSTAEVGYMLLERFQGKGYGSESLQTVMTFARDVLGVHTLKGVVTEGNSASCRMLEKCGFVLKQRKPDACIINGQLFADLIYRCDLACSGDRFD